MTLGTGPLASGNIGVARLPTVRTDHAFVCPFIPGSVRWTAVSIRAWLGWHPASRRPAAGSSRPRPPSLADRSLQSRRRTATHRRAPLRRFILRPRSGRWRRLARAAHPTIPQARSLWSPQHSAHTLLCQSDYLQCAQPPVAGRPAWCERARARGPQESAVGVRTRPLNAAGASACAGRWWRACPQSACTPTQRRRTELRLRGRL